MNASIRSWHTWVSIILAVPIVLVSATAILIAHDDGLGTKTIAIGEPKIVSGAPEVMDHGYELRAYSELSSGHQLYGTKYGLIMRAPGKPAEAVEAIGSTDVRDIANVDGQIFVATIKGLWRMSPGGEWSKVAAGDFWTVSGSGTAIQAVSKKDGLLESRDGGQTFAAAPGASEALSAFAGQNGAPPYTLNKLVMDIHTGKLFFGKEYEWIWIDLVGGVMVFLTISGLIMWRRAERRKASMAAKSAPQARGLEAAAS
jgi:hypothetical protein